MMNELGNQWEADVMQVDGKTRRRPWFAFLFLFMIFALATPYELTFTVGQRNLDDMVESAEEGSFGRRVALPLLGIYGLFCLLNPRNRKVRLNGFLGLGFACFLALTFASLFWAEDWVLSVRRLTAYGLLTIGGVGLAVRFSVREIALFVSFVCIGVIFLAFGAEVILGTFLKNPNYQIYQFSGVMHPNATGAYCAIGGISSFALSKMERHHRKLYLFLTILSVGFLLMTKSRTASGSAIIVLFFFWAVTTCLKRKFITFIIVGMLLCFLGLTFSDGLGDKVNEIILLGRASEGNASSLSNRLPLWQECLSYVEKRPLLGYGYASFWTPRHIYTISTHQGWEVPHSHNGYLEIMLGLGILGLFFYLFVLITFLKNTFTRWLLYRNVAVLFGFFMIFWLCLEMILESVYMFPVFPSFACDLLIARLAFVESEEDWSPVNHSYFEMDEISPRS
jgi:O-antigen ligase